MSTSFDQWQHAAVSKIFNITLNRSEAESSGWNKVYLKQLSEELGSQIQLTASIADQILIARLSLDPTADVMSDDADHITILASLPKGQTSWDYIIACWKNARVEESRLRKSLAATDHQKALPVLQEIRSLLVSYAGLVLQTPDMFPNASKPNNIPLSPLVLIDSLTRVSSSISSFDFSHSTSSHTNVDLTTKFETIDGDDLPVFLNELTNRFGNEEGLDEILGPAFTELTRRIRDGDRGSDAPASSSSTSAAASASGPGGVNPAALNQALNNQDVQSVIAQLLAGRMPSAPDGAGANPLRAPAKPTEGLAITGLEWRPYVNAIVESVELKPIASMLAHLANFDPPNTTGSRIELDSLFGPVLRLSSFPDAYPSITRHYFANASSQNPQETDSNFRSIQSTMDIVHTLNFRIFNAIVRSGAAAREKVLSYWARACALNAKRGAMQVRQELVASDGYMVNLYEMLLRFADPFMDAGLTKIDRIDLEYLRKQTRFDLGELTRINATEGEAKEWSDKAPGCGPPANFITEVFYMALRLNNLGLGKAVRRIEDKEKEMGRFKKRIAETEADRAMWSALPQAPQYENFLKRAKDEVNRLHGEIFAAQAQLMAPEFLQKVITFNCFVMTWLIRIAEPNATHPHAQVKLPLPQEVPERFRMLPEHIFEDICDVMLFISRVSAPLSESAKNDLVTFCTTFLSSGWYIKNPFLKAKLAEILFYNVIPWGRHTNGVLCDTLNIHALALQHLVPALMNFWIEAENTGSHTQFYDKFNMRYHLSQIFKSIWSNPKHKQQIHIQASKEEGGDFVVFINRLMNDVTYLLDDALDKLQELHTKQSQVETNTGESAQEQQEREGHIRQLEQTIKSDLELGTEFLRLLIDFTAEAGEAFMTPEVVSRLAAMLDYNLDLMAGPKCQNLKVKQAKKVSFEPRNLLRMIMSVYLNLCSKGDFITAIAQDGRSYSKAVFEKAGWIAERYMLKSPPELEAWMGMIGQVEEKRQMEADEEEDLGEVPDEFLDPLMATVMRDPVLLPTSKIVVDRSTIKAHLLSDSTDPFNRSSLKIDDVVPDTQLKQKIEAFIAERRRK
ncbi:related to UFD2 - ubiquitin fusion degradation protein [Melanopsichium pennsylvanicum]|uniref:RING-type E3 ubiquitin transferase n=2 Tax=Melanopsichium pennsylvanicum TaxID=63383 RepID=A0AAJ5C4Q8_9BASI|nr:related to UFD2-ubiquitin fusion degradation protein [Melanopsichium pennsylvanicum 4]SNX83910.1 related to UFD2 - ubiquitin fusion degradation protein [Melanopsichium pennsylvanicum]